MMKSRAVVYRNEQAGRSGYTSIQNIQTDVYTAGAKNTSKNAVETGFLHYRQT